MFVCGARGVIVDDAGDGDTTRLRQRVGDHFAERESGGSIDEPVVFVATNSTANASTDCSGAAPLMR